MTDCSGLRIQIAHRNPMVSPQAPCQQAGKPPAWNPLSSGREPDRAQCMQGVAAMPSSPRDSCCRVLLLLAMPLCPRCAGATANSGSPGEATPGRISTSSTRIYPNRDFPKLITPAVGRRTGRRSGRRAGDRRHARPGEVRDLPPADPGPAQGDRRPGAASAS